MRHGGGLMASGDRERPVLACGIAWAGWSGSWQPCPALVLPALPGLLRHSSHRAPVLRPTGRAWLRSLLAGTAGGEGTSNRRLRASGTAAGQQMGALCSSSRSVPCQPLGTDPSFPRRQAGTWGLQPSLQTRQLLYRLHARPLLPPKPLGAPAPSRAPGAGGRAWLLPCFRAGGREAMRGEEEERTWKEGRAPLHPAGRRTDASQLGCAPRWGKM